MISKGKGKATTSVIEISGVGPVIQRTIPIATNGGITVLKGENGAGKSYCLEAVRSRLGAKVRLEANDTLGKGEIIGFGGRTTVAKQVRQSKQDDLAVAHIEDRYDLSKLVEPGMKDAESNDAARLRALVQLGGMDVPAERFAQITSGLDVDLEVALAETDLLARVAAAKRILQSRARDFEKLESEERKRQAAAEANLDGVDLSQPVPDLESLQKEHDTLVASRASLTSQVAEAARDFERRTKANAALQAELGRYSGPSPREAAADVAKAKQAVADAQEALRKAESWLQNAVRVQEMAAMHYERLDESKSILDQPAIVPPTDVELAAAERAVQSSHERMAAALRLRDARKHAETAQKYRATADGFADQAKRLREACGAVDALLVEAIDCPEIRWLEGRMLYRHEDGRVELFDRLSDGLRWHFAIRVGAKRVRKDTGDGTNLLILPQVAWQDLQPMRRDMVFDLAVTERVNILTAECDDGPLRAVLYGEPDPWLEAQKQQDLSTAT